MSTTRQPFNPCSLDKNEQIPAKIWELLRHNDAFRADARKLEELDSQERGEQARGSYHGPAWEKSNRLVHEVKQRHPFAPIALQWLVPEPLFVVHHVPRPLGTKWKEQRAFRPRVLGVGEGTTPDTADKEHWRWWKNDSQANRAGRRIRRGPHVYWTMSKFKRLSGKVNPLKEWQRFRWPFTVDHSWDKAPLAFRRHFQFIWRSRFDARPVNPISRSRSDSPHVHETEFFKGCRLEAFRASGNLSYLVKVLKFDELADNYRIFAVPKTILTKDSANAMGRWLCASFTPTSENKS